MVSKTNFRKLKGTTGIYKHNKTGHYYAEKRVKGILKSHTFRTLHEAKRWRNELLQKIPIKEKSEFATLEEVWEVMQAFHFPLLATTTRGKISEWVTYWVGHFSTEEYRTSGRGRAERCNLNNELNMFVTIFNWYKESEQFESEAQSLTCPVKKKHRKMGFIRPLPDKKSRSI